MSAMYPNITGRLFSQSLHLTFHDQADNKNIQFTCWNDALRHQQRQVLASSEKFVL